MLEVRFMLKEDATRFQQKVQESSSTEQTYLTQNQEEEYIVATDEDNWSDEVKCAFIQWVFEYKQYEWARAMLKKRYFYEDESELEQILDILTSILEGHRQEVLPLAVLFEQEKSFKTTVNEVFNDSRSFSFDSFLRFRMRGYLDHVEELVGRSIDEYKMEQEYQMFIQMLRDFLRNRPAVLDELHVVLQEKVCFFDARFCEIKRKELTAMIDRKLLLNYPVYIDSIAIAPLLSIAPRTIYLYTDESEQPLVRTLVNIFEERLVLLAHYSFLDKNGQSVK